MNITGIICEYNPFHNGHLYHIEQAKKITNSDVLVCVLSGNYNQRGDVSIIHKFDKTKVALNNGVDLVLELPYIFVTQNAYVFAKNAVTILDKIGCNNLVFGSETNNLQELEKYASLQVDVTRLKELMHDGNSFPKAYGLLSSSLYSNDILAVAYLKALSNTSIKPFSIQRTNSYLSDDIQVISSASAIRKAIQQEKDYHIATSLNINEPLFNDNFYPCLRNLLFSFNKEELRQIFLVEEGIENMLVKNAILFDHYEDFITHSISRRYTRSRIQRTCLQILNNIQKKEVIALPDFNYIRVLGFNSKGQALLRNYDNDFKLVTQFKNIPEAYKEIEWKTSLNYANQLKDSQAYLKQELKGPIIVNL